MRIENQVHAQVGQLKGPAPVPHQVREVSVRIESLPGGRLRVSSPAARGWAAVVGNQQQLSEAITSAFVEAQVAAYARWKAERYDLDELTEPVTGDPLAPPRARQRRRRNTSEEGWGTHQRRPDAHDPEEWVKMPDGRWQSPTGMRWGANTAMVQRVVTRRRNLGLPT